MESSLLTPCKPEITLKNDEDTASKILRAEIGIVLQRCLQSVEESGLQGAIISSDDFCTGNGEPEPYHIS